MIFKNFYVIPVSRLRPISDLSVLILKFLNLLNIQFEIRMK